MKARSGFIPEIQGLRTVALLMVATFHIWLGKVSGGVDVFLLISAYLLTRSLVGKSENGSRTRPLTFLVRKFARLLPAAAAVIVLTLITAFLLYSEELWRTSFLDAIHSLFYVENIRLQDQAIDYFNADHSNASPFQQFWSLSVQGQVFLGFVLLHYFGDVVAKTFGWPIRKVLLVIFSSVATLSFVFSVWITGLDQAYAYFSTGARLWEFAVGSILAVIQPWLKIGPKFQIVASWVGLAAVLACGFVLPVESSFPGVAALWPVGAATLVILSTSGQSRFGADRVLSRGLLARLGGYTYALYLIHWPVLIFFLSITRETHLNWWEGILVLGISGLLSWLIVTGIERPVARFGNGPVTPTLGHSKGSSRRSIFVLFVSVIIVLMAAIGSNMLFEKRISDAVVAARSLNVAAMGANDTSGLFEKYSPAPESFIVQADWASMGPDCAPDDPYISGLCYEILAQPGDETHSIYAVGSSHSTQFSAALLEAVNRHPSWSLRSQVSPACYYRIRSEISEDCELLWDQAASYVANEKPDLMVLFGTQTQLDYEMDQPGLVTWIREAQLASPMTQFVVMRDNPRNSFSTFECATANGYDSGDCVSSYETETDPEYIDSLNESGAIWVDLNEHICPERKCSPSQGGIVTYLDDGHLTATYVRTLAQWFTVAIRDHVDWWPSNVYQEGVYQNRAGEHDVLEDLNRQYESG